MPGRAGEREEVGRRGREREEERESRRKGGIVGLECDFRRQREDVQGAQARPSSAEQAAQGLPHPSTEHRHQLPPSTPPANMRIPFIFLLVCVAHTCVYYVFTHTCACTLKIKTYPL